MTKLWFKVIGFNGHGRSENMNDIEDAVVVQVYEDRMSMGKFTIKQVREKFGTSVWGNQKGQVSIIMILVIGIIMTGFLLLILGNPFDTITQINNDQIAAGLHVSQEKMDTMNSIQFLFKMSPWICLIALVTWAIVMSLRDRSGGVI